MARSGEGDLYRDLEAAQDGAGCTCAAAAATTIATSEFAGGCVARAAFKDRTRVEDCKETALGNERGFCLVRPSPPLPADPSPAPKGGE